jgi:peroxiredoxin
MAALFLGGLVFFPAAGAGGAKPLPAAPPAALAETAPDFVLHDLKGEGFRLSDWRGKQPVLLIFGTTWCSFCKNNIPHYKKIHAAYAAQGLVIVNVNLRESREKVAAFAAEHRLPYRVLLDKDGAVAERYGVRRIPALLLVDRQGMIVCRQCLDVGSRIEAALKGK